MVCAPAKLAVVGGRRGRSYNRAVKEVLGDKVQIVAICDLVDDVLARWRREFQDIQTYKDYDRMLQESDCDAVYVATPIMLHAEQSIKAMKAGKHVLCEVVAAISLDECWRLVETVRDTKMTYMFAENTCYIRSGMMILNMVQKGVFGELVYGEASYIHDVKGMLFYPDGKLTWRGMLTRSHPGNWYPTHSLGPVVQWLNAAQKNGDRLVRTATFQSKSASLPLYVNKKFGQTHPGAKRDYWAQGDSVVTLIQTEHDALIVLRCDFHSPGTRGNDYLLTGTAASYISIRDNPLIWIEGKEEKQEEVRFELKPPEWESLYKYADKFEHTLWKQWGETAQKGGHGGVDFLTIVEFVDTLLKRKWPPIDVYDGVTWSCITPLSAESLRKGNAPLEIPDFRKGSR